MIWGNECLRLGEGLRLESGTEKRVEKKTKGVTNLNNVCSEPSALLRSRSDFLSLGSQSGLGPDHPDIVGKNVCTCVNMCTLVDIDA